VLGRGFGSKEGLTLSRELDSEGAIDSLEVSFFIYSSNNLVAAKSVAS